jgi:hypothetical protein
MNPNGETPAYEWNFSDVNPPVRHGPPGECSRSTVGSGAVQTRTIKAILFS